MTVEERQRHTGREPDPDNPLPVITPSNTFETVSEQISSIVLTRKTPLFWWCTFGIGRDAACSCLASPSPTWSARASAFGASIFRSPGDSRSRTLSGGLGSAMPAR